ncbi:integrase, partial [Clostridium sporogenes PA 3679]
RKYNSYKGNVGTVAPNRIKQRFSTKIPYQKITTDTSEFKIYTTNTSGKVVIKKAYFDVFLDMYNGEVLSYR